MSKSLTSFLERRSKNSLKTATLLLQVDDSAEEEKSEEKSLDGEEVASEHDDEWKLSDDNQPGAFDSGPTLGAGLLKIVQTVGNRPSQESGGIVELRSKTQVWGAASKTESPESEPQVEESNKKWVPKFKSVGPRITDDSNDVDLAESAKLAAAKSAATKVTKKKKKPASTSTTQLDDDSEQYIKIKFNVFNIVSKDEYGVFDNGGEAAIEDLVMLKYSNLEPFVQATLSPSS
ncbi:hypothetical protein BdWA1_002836 [Babesia duncani]|uniref:Uncharacterized protein n=1 Tax=Babesia duncani TaxID=323732 RepID=A0AAD9PKH9_9APIC|nr:hypothetical protein BdWA1_003671 [Babesia duncani]KAK2196236.1 hypothetical protein BdWA1_002836 [Babesia duncani]